MIFFSTVLENFDLNSEICENMTIINYSCSQGAQELKSALSVIAAKKSKQQLLKLWRQTQDSASKGFENAGQEKIAPSLYGIVGSLGKYFQEIDQVLPNRKIYNFF